MLHELLRRGEMNGVPLKVIYELEALDIEPRVKTYKNALCRHQHRVSILSMSSQALKRICGQPELPSL